MVDIELAKAFLKEHHVATTSWHTVLNNTTGTRSKAQGGKVVRSLNDHKLFEAQGAGSATPMIRCTLQLPNSFAEDDGKKLEVTGVGANRDEASEDACCGAMVHLLCAEPTNVVLRPTHWTIPIGTLLTQFLERVGQTQPGTPHQPLAVHCRRAAPTAEIEMDDDQKKQAIEEVLRRCLHTHDGEFDPSNISRKRYGLGPDDPPPWVILDASLNPGGLRTFVEEHPEFAYRAHGSKGMIITWAAHDAAGPLCQARLLPHQTPQHSGLQTIPVSVRHSGLAAAARLLPQAMLRHHRT